MNPQLNLFTSRQARDKGIAKVSSHNVEMLKKIRVVAIQTAKAHYPEPITIEEVQWDCDVRGIECPHPNLWGAVFKIPEFECCGFTQSKQVSRHAGLIRLWRLK